jgi:hypothetical protein
MILGLSIPRLYTSFMATKIDLKISDTAAIKPTIAKTYDLMGLKLLLKKNKRLVYVQEENKDKKTCFWNAFFCNVLTGFYNIKNSKFQLKLGFGIFSFRYLSFKHHHNLHKYFLMLDALDKSESNHRQFLYQ